MPETWHKTLFRYKIDDWDELLIMQLCCYCTHQLHCRLCLKLWMISCHQDHKFSPQHWLSTACHSLILHSMCNISHLHLRRHLLIFIQCIEGKNNRNNEVEVTLCTTDSRSLVGHKDHIVNWRCLTKHLRCFPVLMVQTFPGYHQWYTYVLLRVAFPL